MDEVEFACPSAVRLTGRSTRLAPSLNEIAPSFVLHCQTERGEMISTPKRGSLPRNGLHSDIGCGVYNEDAIPLINEAATVCATDVATVL
jgi:hypothetical protein